MAPDLAVEQDRGAPLPQGADGYQPSYQAQTDPEELAAAVRESDHNDCRRC